ncbi:MAG: hypothetical protein JO146_05670 [Candidatus Eremiobacteraeota bacterium]|nr:hypothetical protein [Candidatus Eremiobacteraeota bacterium]
MLELAASLGLFGSIGYDPVFATPLRDSRCLRFERWVLERQISDNNLCRYYRYGPHASEESPLATAYAILLLNRSHPEIADRLADGITALQGRFASNRYVSGGVPSIANDDSLMFYSSDALAAIKALMAVYKRSGATAPMHAAKGFVEFVHRLVDGERAGFLVENLDFPMQYVRPNGDFQNWLVPNVAMLFWDALRDYAEAAGDAATARLFERGRTLLLRSAQADNGAFYDHYDPGYPPRGYSPERWRWYKINPDGARIAIGDNMMMSALGALRMGDTAAVDRFLQWARPTGGKFYAYIDVESGGSGFLHSDRRYFDVVSSAMYYELLEARGRLTDATRRQLEAVFKQSAADDGGYRWGLRASDDGWVQDSAEALVTGYWIAQTC